MNVMARVKNMDRAIPDMPPTWQNRGHEALTPVSTNTARSRGSTPEEAEAKRILQERARLLAQEPPPAPTGEVIEVVEFVLGNEHYGVASTLVREVYPLKDFTPLPGTPDFILGLMNVRGQILSITDLRILFGLPEKGLTTANRVIILKNANREFAILADTIVGIRIIPLATLQEGLPTLTGLAGEFIKGITPDRLAILDGEKLLSDNRLVVNEEFP
jgi:purine-binding chemotaxis protein CheW